MRTRFDSVVTDPTDEPKRDILEELSDLFRFADVVEDAADFPVVGRPLPIHPTRGTPASVLIIDADEGSRTLQRARLEDAGYVVHASGTATRGLDIARAKHVDVVLVDGRLADLDGWGVLCALRAAAAVSETKVVIMSSDPGALYELACASVGADSYYEKSKSDVAEVVDKVLARRFGVLAQLGHGAWGTLSDVGIQSLLDGGCGTGKRGRLEVDDGVNSWRIDVDRGVIAQARMCAADASDVDDDYNVPTDRQALFALLNVRDAPWSFDLLPTTPPRTLGLPWCRIARELCAELDERRARLRSNLLAQPRTVALDAARLAVWFTIADEAPADVARALQQGAIPRDLVADPWRSPLLVDEVLQDLVDRNIVLLLPEPTTPRVRWTPTTAVRPAMQPRCSSRLLRTPKREKRLPVAERQ
jgi:CheY-like chemotaxis protein